MSPKGAQEEEEVGTKEVAEEVYLEEKEDKEVEPPQEQAEQVSSQREDSSHGSVYDSEE